MRALGFVMLLALLAHSIPLPSLAFELPVTGEPAAEPEDTTETLPELLPASELEPELLPSIDAAPTEAREDLSVSRESLLLQASPAPGLLLDQNDTSHDIGFPGGSGGKYRYLEPAPLYIATASGAAAKVRMYLARNIETTETPFGGNVLIVTLNSADGSGHHICTLFEAQQNVSITNALTNNYSLIPVGDASAVALVELDASTGDCVLEEGTTYEVRLVNQVNGDPRWTNGILYSKGADASAFFLQVTATDFPPEEPEPCEECASNVLFIPGIKGSRLYVDDGEEEKVWDPIGNEDIRSLFLDGEGTSNHRVYTKDGDVLGSVAGFLEFYQGFLDSLGSLANDGSINDWEAVAYDWRLSLDEIVTTGLKEDDRIYYGEATSTPYIEQTLRSLAASSKTGKVTIVAHSNGGLVTKALLSRLGDAETSELVDKIVFVGVPQSGAPQALGALLFGYKEGLPWWFPFMVSPAVAREMAENSPMGYHLLPTQNYFDSIASDSTHQVVRFNANTLYSSERDTYGETLDSQTELYSYLHAEDGGRTKPPAERYEEPNVLSSFFTSYAASAHNAIDGWRPPQDVMLYQIAGWGEDTVSGVEFYEECVSLGCKGKYRPMFIEDGDGVVPIPSALMIEEAENVEQYWVDLNFINGDHGNILNAEPLNDFIDSLIKKNISLPSNISDTQPISTGSKKLLFILHSPLTLEVVDQNGNRTGPNEDGSKSEEIGDSSYGRFGETQYVLVPSGSEYNVMMRGTSAGRFSIDIQEMRNGEPEKISTIANVPNLGSTYATFSISEGVEDASSLEIDFDGDGDYDSQISFVANETTEQSVQIDSQQESTITSGIGSPTLPKTPTEEIPALDRVAFLGTNTPGDEINKVALVGEVRSYNLHPSYEDGVTQGTQESVIVRFTKEICSVFVNLWNFFYNLLSGLLTRI